MSAGAWAACMSAWPTPNLSRSAPARPAPEAMGLLISGHHPGPSVSGGLAGEAAAETRTKAGMTANRNLKRRVGARAAKTGESYAAALRHMKLVRLATAQVVVRARRSGPR